MQRAMAGRPEVGGFPYLAETLRRRRMALSMCRIRRGKHRAHFGSLQKAQMVEK